MQESHDRMRNLFLVLKKQHDNAVMLFEMGNSYEAFYEDAETLDRIYGSNNKDRHTVSEADLCRVIMQVWIAYGTDIIVVREEHVPGSDTCIACGADVPEGRQVCKRCEESL